MDVDVAGRRVATVYASKRDGAPFGAGGVAAPTSVADAPLTTVALTASDTAAAGADVTAMIAGPAMRGGEDRQRRSAASHAARKAAGRWEAATGERRLSAESSSFSTILTGALVDAAAAMLESATARLAEVAFVSGFAE